MNTFRRHRQARGHRGRPFVHSLHTCASVRVRACVCTPGLAGASGLPAIQHMLFGRIGQTFVTPSASAFALSVSALPTHHREVTGQGWRQFTCKCLLKDSDCVENLQCISLEKESFIYLPSAAFLFVDERRNTNDPQSRAPLLSHGNTKVKRSWQGGTGTRTWTGR